MQKNILIALIAFLVFGTAGVAQGNMNKLKDKAGEKNIKKTEKAVKKEAEKIVEKGKEKVYEVIGNKEAALKKASAKKA